MKQSFQDLQNMLNEADEKRDGGEREEGERGEGGDREGGEMEGGEMDEGEGEKREETKDEGEVGEEGGGEGVRSKVQEPTADEVEPAETSEEPENEGVDIGSETPASAATEELQGNLCSNPDTTPLPPAISESNKAVEDATQPNTMPAVQDDEHNNERVQLAQAEEQFPVENVDAVETTEDASPRQPEEATTTSNEYASQTTDDASPRQPEATPPSSEDAKTASPPQPEKATPPSNTPIPCEENMATPTRNQTLTSVQFREDSLEGCLKKFCSVEILTGVNQFCCEVCTRQRASEISAAVRARSAARPLSRANSDTRERNIQQADECKAGDLEIRGKELSADSELALLPLAEESKAISSESRQEANIREGNLQLAEESRAKDSPGRDKTPELSPDSELAVSELIGERVKNSSELMGKDGSLVTDCERCSRAQQPVDSEQVSEFTGEQVQLPESRGEDCQAEMVCKCSQSTVSDSLTSSCTSVSRDGALCNGRAAQPESLESGVVKKTPAEEGEGEEEEGEIGEGEEEEEKGEEGEKVDLCQVTEGEEGGVRGNGKDTLGGGSGDRGGTSRETGDNSRSSSHFESTSDSESKYVLVLKDNPYFPWYMHK